MKKDLDFNLKEIIKENDDLDEIDNSKIDSVIQDLKIQKLNKQLFSMISNDVHVAIQKIVKETKNNKNKVVEHLLRKALGLPSL